MALELGLKVTRTGASDNATSVSELCISKNTSGPVFVSTETHASFILTCYLKGYDRNSFQIKISEDGKEISISGEKLIPEMLMMGRVIMLKKNVEVVGFRKVFKIPNGVFLDRIKAKFDEDESLLKIVMPKLVKGICGCQIEEVKSEGFGKSSQNQASETGENECVCREEGGLSDKKLVESTNGDVTADTIPKEIERPRCEAVKKSELGENADHIAKNIGGESSGVLKEPVLQQLEEGGIIMPGRPPGTTREEKFEGVPRREIGEVGKFEHGGEDEERVGAEMSKKGLEIVERSQEGGESEKASAGKIRVSGKDEAAEIEQGEIQEPKFGTEDRGEQRVKDMLEETQKEETEENKFACERKNGERVGAKISKDGLEAIGTGMEGREPKKVLAGAFGINVEDIIQGKQKKGIEEIKFEREGKNKEWVGTKISKGGLEAIDTTKEGRESEKELDGAVRVDEKGIIDKNKQRGVEEDKLETGDRDEEREGRESTMLGTEDRGEQRVKHKLEGAQKEEIEETKFECGGKDEERVGIETSKEELEAIDTTIEGGESGEVLTRENGVDEKGRNHENIRREVGEAELETEGKDDEREGRETTKGELEAIETRMEGVETKSVHGGKIEVSKEGVLSGIKQKKIEDKDKERLKDIIGGTQKRDIQKLEPETGRRGEERAGTETSKEGLEAIGIATEGGESKMVLAGSIFKGREEKEIGKNKFAIEGKVEERVRTKIKEDFEVKDTTIEGGVSEKLLSDATGASGKDIVEQNKKGEVDVPKFENESRDEEMLKEEISNDGVEARKTKIKGSPMQEPRLPIQSEESEGIFEGIERSKDKSEGAKLKEIEEPKQSVKENGKIPKCATSKGENLEEIGEATEAMAKRWSQEAEEISEKIEGEEPRTSKEESKVNGNDYARDSGTREIEEPVIRSCVDGRHVQNNIVGELFEELGTDTGKFSKQISETKAQREKEVKVKEEIIVRREREVKVKEEVIVNKYDETKEGFERAATGDRIQTETGQPSDERGFDEGTLEAAKWDITKAAKEGSAETEFSLEKAIGESNDNVQGAVFSPFMKDNKRGRTETTQKVPEDPKVGTKQKAQHHVQELPMKVAESMDEREGPKDTKKEEMKEAKRKSGETQVVADEESIIEEKIHEAEIDRIGKTNQFEKALQEVPEAKDPKALGKGIRERESTLSTQQLEVKEIDEACEECTRPETNLEREKWKTTQSVEDEKLRREHAIKQVAKSMQEAPEKEHPGKSEVEIEVKHLEAKVVPELREEVETKNEVEGSSLKGMPPPKVEVQSLEPLELEKKNVERKSPKIKKLVPEAREGEEYEAGKPPEMISSSSDQQAMVDEQKSEINFPKSNTSRTTSEETGIEALPANVLSDQNLVGKEQFKTLTEDRGHYLLEKEKILETKKVAEEQKLNQKDEEETLSCKRERTKIAGCNDEKRKMKRNGSEQINQIKEVAEEFRDVLADKETEKPQEILLPQTAEIQGKEKISEIREVQQEKRREIPFHANEESGAVIAESQKPNAAHPKESSIKFSSDKPKGEVDKLQRTKLLSPSVEKVSKGSSKTSRSGVKEDAPTVEIVPKFQEGKEATCSLEVTKASETVANELDKPPAEKLEVVEEGQLDECRDGRHLEVQEPEKHESELDYQESTRRRSDQAVEKTHLSQQEENYEGHAIEEEKVGEAENVTQVEVSQESEDLEDIEVEESEKKVELRAPLVFAGSVLIGSLIIFFFGHKGAGKR